MGRGFRVGVRSIVYSGRWVFVVIVPSAAVIKKSFITEFPFNSLSSNMFFMCRPIFWHGGVKKFGQLALVEPNGVFLHQQVYAGAAVFGLINQDVGHGFSPFSGGGRLKNIAGLFFITFLIFVIFFVIRSVEPIVPAKQFEQCVKAVLVGGADKYAVCVAVRASRREN